MPLTHVTLDIWKLHNSAMRSGPLFRRDGRLLAQNHRETGNIAAYSQFIQGTQQTPMLFPLFQMPQNAAWKGLATRVVPVLRAFRGGGPTPPIACSAECAVQRLGRPQPIVRWMGRQFFLHSKMPGFFRACGLIFANECAGDIVWKEWRGCGTSSTLRNSFSSPKPGGTLAPQASQFLAPRYAVIHEKVYRLLLGECPFGRSRSWLVTR
jgi:hypothetical protein